MSPAPASDNRLEAATAGGGLAEAVCGIGVIGLAIAGLAGAIPVSLAGIAQIVFGIGLLCGDSAVVACVMQVSTRRGRTTAMPFGGGLGAETIVGMAGIVLGILTLIGVVPYPLSAISVIVFGGGVLFGSAGRARSMTHSAACQSLSAEQCAAVHDAQRAALGAGLHRPGRDCPRHRQHRLRCRGAGHQPGARPRRPVVPRRWQPAHGHRFRRAGPGFHESLTCAR